MLPMPLRRPALLPQAVSVLGFGTWSLGGESFGGRTAQATAKEEAEALRAVHRALDLGVTFFDTADSYGGGNAERLLGRALAQRPGAQVVLSTKFGSTPSGKDFSPAHLERALQGSLERLGRDRVELLLFHSPPDDFDWAGYPVAVLERLRAQGRIGAWGVSCQTHHGAERVLRAGFGQAVEVVYNALDRRPEAAVLPLAQRAGAAVIARVPLASGFLTGRYSDPRASFSAADVRSTLPAEEVAWRVGAAQRLAFLADEPGGMATAALRFCASHPGVTTVIPGMRTVAEVEANLGDQAKRPLGGDLLARVRAAVPAPYPGWEKAGK